MVAELFLDLCKNGENSIVEFKSCQSGISHSVYESVCSMLNRNGGTILLGVADDGEILGVDSASANDVVKNIVDTLNNAEAFLPTPYITPEIVIVDGKCCIALNVPAGLYVYRYKGKYWDRIETADYDVTDSPEQLISLFERKNPHLFEDREVEGMIMEDIDHDTIQRCRNMLSVTNPTHIWISMTDEELLVSAKLLQNTDRNRFKYAALLLFGTEDALQRLMPRYRFEAIYRTCTFAQYQRMEDLANRYDDRITLRCNLINAYSKLIEFATRHMPDKFYLPGEGTQRLDLRIALMREIVGNLCVHSDFSAGFACFMEIFSDCAVTRNASRLIPQTPEGDISIRQLGNYTKNPLLVKVFHELNWVEDLGSGTRNILKYAPLYYPNYRIGISNGQQFVFALTYADNGENVGKNNEMSVKNVGINDEMSVKNVGKKNKATEKKNRRQQAIIGLIQKDPHISQAHMAETLDVSLKTIERDTEELCRNGILRFEGDIQNGTWVIISRK